MINKELEQYKKSKQASYEALQARCNELEFLNRKLEQECEKLRKDVDPCAYKSKLAIDCASGYKQALDEIYQYAYNEYMLHFVVGQEAKYLDIDIIFKIFKKAGYKIYNL